AVADVTVLGKGRIAGLRRSWYLRGGIGFTNAFTAGVDYKNFDQAAPNLETPIHYLPFSLDYSGNTQDKSGTSQFSLATVFSIRGVGNNPDDFADARFKAQPNFFILRWDIQRNQNLPASFVLAARVDGQIADQPLINNEQYFAGGLMNIRGYLESEAL